MKKGPHQTNRQLRQQVATLEARLAEYEQAVREAQQVKEALRQAEDALQLRGRALEAVTQGVVILDATSPDHRVLYVNPAFERMTGLPWSDVLGRPSDFLLAGAGGHPPPAPLGAARAGAQPWSGEVQYQRPDGRTWWAEVAFTPMARGAARYTIGALADVSERKRLEAQLVHSQKMDAIGRLAGGVAHDFNNILSVILGYGELLGSGAGLTPAQAEAVAEIRKAAESAVRMTRQLLAFSRKQVLRPSVLDLNAVVNTMDRFLRRLIGEDVSLGYHLDPALAPVRADPGQLEQVLLNLVVNARDALPRGGRVTVETANVVLDEARARTRPEVRPGPYVLLAVSDNGCGMDEHVKAHLFEPFFTTKELGQGTGLGLATTYGFVKQSGGYVYVYSEVGRGTTFKIYLPAVAITGTAEPGPAAPEQNVERSFQGTETILLAEDDDAVCTVATTVLRQNGYTVLPARNGAEALWESEQHAGRIHLLLTDVVMPEMSGRQLAERLAPSRRGMRVLYLSGYTPEAVHRHGLLDVADFFLAKPFTPSILLQKVREVLDAPAGR